MNHERWKTREVVLMLRQPFTRPQVDGPRSFHTSMSACLAYITTITNQCFARPPLTEQQATVTIPGTNISIPLSALTGNQMISIPGSNIIQGGISIPTSQAISIPTSQAISIPCSSGVLPGIAIGGDKTKETKQEGSPPAQGLLHDSFFS